MTTRVMTKSAMSKVIKFNRRIRIAWYPGFLLEGGRGRPPPKRFLMSPKTLLLPPKISRKTKERRIETTA